MVLQNLNIQLRTPTSPRSMGSEHSLKAPKIQATWINSVFYKSLLRGAHRAPSIQIARWTRLSRGAKMRCITRHFWLSNESSYGPPAQNRRLNPISPQSIEPSKWVCNWGDASTNVNAKASVRRHQTKRMKLFKLLRGQFGAHRHDAVTALTSDSRGRSIKTAIASFIWIQFVVLV